MQTETTFTAHLLSTPKREWLITVGNTPFAIVRSTPEGGAAHPDYASYHRARVRESWDTWTLFVLSADGERIEVAMSPGMWITRRSDEPSRVASVAQNAIAGMMEAARHYVEAITRLAVMLDALMFADDLRKASKKARKLREAAAVQLHARRVLVQDRGRTVSVIAGDAVLVVSKQYSGEWNELTYRVGDQAVHGSYNRVYIGEVTSISPKTITVVDGSTTRRMTHARFVGRNTTKMEVHYKRNAEWTD